MSEVLCPLVAGRDEELAVLDHAPEEALAGRRMSVLLGRASRGGPPCESSAPR